jgi:alpha-L-fucosidase
MKGKGKIFRCCLVILFPLTAAAQQMQVKLLSRVPLFDSTALFASCHASTIVSLNNNRLLCAWFGGSAEGNPDVAIWSSAKENGQWSAPRKLADGRYSDGKNYPCWNPVLFRVSAHTVYLFYKVGPNPREWWGMYKISQDNGTTWSEAVRLPDGFLGPVRNKPLLLENGTILYPSSTESANGRWQIQMECSDTLLRQWHKQDIVAPGIDAIQPAILKHPGGKLQILCRSKQNVITEAFSADSGKKWSAMKATKMPNPNAGIDAVSVNNHLHLLVYNPLTAGKEWWEGRSVLKLAFSENGEDWKDIYTIEDHVSGEYSYPAIIADKEGVIHITYTDRRKTIRYLSLQLTEK